VVESPSDFGDNRAGFRISSTKDAVMTLTSKRKNATRPIQILIVDDHPLVREGLATRISSQEGFEVCGEAADLETALELARTTKPDLVIVDISLAGTSGIDLVKAIKQEFDDLPVLVVSMHDESLYGERALRAGAMGYVMKSEPAKTALAALRKVLRGEVHVSEKMASAVVAKFVQGTEPPPSPLESLSDRELEVFRLLGQEKGTRQIAETMNVALPTVATFKNRIKEKLGMKNSTEMMLFAIQWFRQEHPA
jgi:DNA-binding NarL/FixJ family response regulator